MMAEKIGKELYEMIAEDEKETFDKIFNAKDKDIQAKFGKTKDEVQAAIMIALMQRKIAE